MINQTILIVRRIKQLFYIICEHCLSVASIFRFPTKTNETDIVCFQVFVLKFQMFDVRRTTHTFLKYEVNLPTLNGSYLKPTEKVIMDSRGP